MEPSIYASSSGYYNHRITSTFAMLPTRPQSWFIPTSMPSYLTYVWLPRTISLNTRAYMYFHEHYHINLLPSYYHILPPVEYSRTFARARWYTPFIKIIPFYDTHWNFKSPTFLSVHPYRNFTCNACTFKHAVFIPIGVLTVTKLTVTIVSET